MQNFLKGIKKNQPRMVKWADDHLLGLFILNLSLMLLVLLHGAGYFTPFFDISINVIVLLFLILTVFLLGARSRVFFGATLLFWVFAGLLRILSVEVWAERTAVYAFEVLVLGVVLRFFESRYTTCQRVCDLKFDF